MAFSDSIPQSYVVRLQQLIKAVDSLKEPMLKHRFKMLAAWASGYFDKGYSRNHMINFMDRGVSTVTSFLVSGNPKMSVTTKIPRLRSWAKVLELATNFWIEQKLNLAKNVLKPMVVEAQFGPTASRVFNKFDRLIDYNDESIQVAEPYVAIIDLESYIFDPSAKNREYFAFEGDRYKLPTKYAKEFFTGKDVNGKDLEDWIAPDSKLMENFSVKEIVRPDMDPSKLSDVDYTTFVDLYLRNERTIITIMPEGKKPVILREIEWDGPEEGPYDVLQFKSFPGSAFGVPPAWSWHDLDLAINILAEKMRQQAEGQKDVVIYQGDAEEDFRKAAQAPNMGGISVRDINLFKQFSLGGVNEDNYKWFQLLGIEFTKQGANPDILGGRGADAPTLGQEQLIYSNATRTINNMYTTFQDYMVSMIRKLIRQFYDNPLEYVPVVLDVPGIGSLPKIYSDVDKVGEFYDFIFDIVPFSTQRKGPELKGRDMMQMATQWILPTLQMAMQQGAQFDIPTFTGILADLLGIDNLSQYYKTAIPKETDSVNYLMTDQKSKQGNDSLGAQEWSRQINSDRQAKVEKDKSQDLTQQPPLVEGTSNA